eukprot:314237-Prorocentrum_minimum.AAC.2
MVGRKRQPDLILFALPARGLSTDYALRIRGAWGVVWSSEDAQRASTPTTDRESRCTSDDQRRRPRAPTLNY